MAPRTKHITRVCQKNVKKRIIKNPKFAITSAKNAIVKPKNRVNFANLLIVNNYNL